MNRKAFGGMVGLPAAYDFGVQRVAWSSVPIANWIRDEGFLWKLGRELRRFNLTGDIQWFKRRIARKYCVDIDYWAEKQREEITMPGSLTLMVPSRKNMARFCTRHCEP